MVSVFFLSVSRAVFTPDLKLVFFDSFSLLVFPKAFISKHSFLILWKQPFSVFLSTTSMLGTFPRRLLISLLRTYFDISDSIYSAFIIFPLYRSILNWHSLFGNLTSSIRKPKSFWAKKLCCYFLVCLSETSFWDQLFRKRGSLLCGPIRWGRTWPIPWCCHSANYFNIRLGKQFGD